jgi:hypothetical protein
LKKQRERAPGRRKAARVIQRIREFFSSLPPFRSNLESSDDVEGGLGVREPRRPIRPSLSGAVALDAPSDEKRDVWAVGYDNRT